MKYSDLTKIKKLYFGYEEIAKALGISLSSARVSANRYLKQGFLLRLKRNLYILRQRWPALNSEERFLLANLAQVPSYISLMTAMDYYGLTTQIQRNFIESIALKRTKEIEFNGTIFNYSKIDEKLYFGFAKESACFIARPEKAFLDAVYLTSLKRYKFDLTSIDLAKLDIRRLKRMARVFPQKTKEALKKYGCFKKA